MRKASSPVFVVLFSAFLLLYPAVSVFAGIQLIPGQGVVLTGADGVVLTGADGVVLTGADGVVLTGADGVVLTGADGVVLTGADAVTYVGLDGVVLTGADATGIRSIDPELAWLLNTVPDTSALNVFIVFYHMPTASDFEALRAVGIFGGTIYHNLPMVLTNATKQQILAVSKLPSVRTIYSNKTVEFLTHDTRILTGENKIATDQTLTKRNNGTPLSGKGVTVAVLDTGIDATHPDLRFGAQVVQNVRVADLQGSSPVFSYPVVVEGISDTDIAMGHGTFVSGIIAGTGAASSGYYGGMAPGANLLGVSCGDASLFFVLSGMDYILSHRVDQNIRVVNCSFGVSGVFDANDPVNIATRIMHDAGITVVFSAGNRGDQPNSLNPYSVADWVIGVGSVNKQGSLSSFSSRGAAAYGLYHPTVVAPGESVVSTRAFGLNVIGASGLIDDVQYVPLQYIPQYTTSSGTSFAAPHVAGTAALMLQANPALTPDRIKQIVQETATPMLAYSRYEVGAGALNTYAAVRKAALGGRAGEFRYSFNNSNITYSREPIVGFTGTMTSGSTLQQSFTLPSDTVYATIEIGWVQPSAASLLSASINGPGKTLQMLAPTILGLPALKKTAATIVNPGAGSWTIKISDIGLPVGTSERVVIAVETIRAHYSINGLDVLAAGDRDTAVQALRTGLLSDRSGSYAGSATATRLEVARALMLGAGPRIPQYIPDAPTFTDEPDDPSAVYIESVTNSPFGDLLGTSSRTFNPGGQIDRTSVAVAVVKALGLDQEALWSVLKNPGLYDWSQIPLGLRGYVSVAVSRGLMSAPSGWFRPSDSIRRSELGMTAVALQNATR